MTAHVTTNFNKHTSIGNSGRSAQMRVADRSSQTPGAGQWLKSCKLQRKPCPALILPALLMIYIIILYRSFWVFWVIQIFSITGWNMMEHDGTSKAPMTTPLSMVSIQPRLSPGKISRWLGRGKRLMMSHLNKENLLKHMLLSNVPWVHHTGFTRCVRNVSETTRSLRESLDTFKVCVRHVSILYSVYR